jgi:hypothetical protein
MVVVFVCDFMSASVLLYLPVEINLYFHEWYYFNCYTSFLLNTIKWIFKLCSTKNNTSEVYVALNECPMLCFL